MLFLIGGKEDVGAAAATILLRFRDVTAKKIGAIAHFAMQLGGGRETRPWKRDRLRQRQVPVPTPAAQIFPPGSESLAGGWAPTTVVTTATDPPVAIDETTTGELLREGQFRK